MRLRHNNTPYWITWSLAKNLFEGLGRGELSGAHHVPTSGPFILAGNHASFFDPPIFGSCVPREICYFARKTLFVGRFGKLITRLNSIPVDRDGDSDVTAIKRVLAALKEGKGILMFPEGTRTPDGNLQPAKRGVGMIACKTGVPVVPARIFGTYECYGKHCRIPDPRVPLAVAIGKAMLPEDYDAGKTHEDRYQEASRRIMEAIAHLKRPL